MSASLITAAMVARDARYSVRVVLPGAHPKFTEAAEAAEHAGVDLAVQETNDGATVHFVARHQDRRVSPTLEPWRSAADQFRCLRVLLIGI